MKHFWAFEPCPFCGDPLVAHDKPCLPPPPWGGNCCVVCGQMLLGELTGQCWKCRKLQWNLDEGRFAFPYRGLWKQLIQEYKIRHRWIHAEFLGAIVASLVSEPWPLVPVPGNPANNRERGFDPVQLMVRKIARCKRLPTLDILIRKRGKSQKALGRSQRKLSVIESTTLRNPDLILPPCVYLVDDVFTTGATANHCAGLLKKAGVRHVVLLAAAGP